MIRRRKKTVNGIEICLLEKDVAYISEENDIDLRPIYETLSQYIDEKILAIPATTLSNLQQESPTLQTTGGMETFLFSGINVSDVKGTIIGDPANGSIVGYDSENGGVLVWKQNPNIRIGLIENVINEYKNNFASINIDTTSLKIPYAVKWTVSPYNSWGGDGKAGIFWADPWSDPIDTYSIKLGYDNSDIGETAYTHNWNFVNHLTYYDDSSITAVTGPLVDYNSVDASRTYNLSDLTMKFANSSNVGRGWVWSRYGLTMGPNADMIPVMSLTNLGVLTTEHSIVSNRYGSILGAKRDPAYRNSLDALGAFHVSGYKDSGATNSWSGDSIISVSNSDLNSGYNGYALLYEHSNFGFDSLGFDLTTLRSFTSTTEGIGHLRLRPITNGTIEVSKVDSGIRKYVPEAYDADTLGATLQSALAYASTGDTIRVGAGIYNTTNLLKNGVNYYFELGAVIDYSGTGTTALFESTASSDYGSIFIGGYGTFINRGNGASGRQIFNIQTGSTLVVYCDTIHSYSGVAIRSSGNGAGSITVRANKIYSKDGTIDNVSNDTTIEIWAGEIYGTDGYVIEQDGGKTIVHGAYIHSDSTSVTPIVVASPDCYIELYECIISAGTGQGVFAHEAGSDDTQCKFFNCGFSSDQTYALQGACTIANCYNLDGSQVLSTDILTTLSHHNTDVVSLQGGNGVDEFYHLNLSDYTSLTGYTYASNEPTGFVNTNRDATLSFDTPSRTLTITATGSTFDVMVNGILYKPYSGSVSISTDQGLHHIVYSANGSLVSLGTGATINDFIKNNAYVCNIFWDSARSIVVGIGDERHGVEMSSETHKYLHTVFGSAYISGLGVTGTNPDGTGNNNIDAALGVSSGVFVDEDLQHDILTVATGATIPVVYMSGATGRWSINSPRIHPVMTGGTGRATYNLNTAGNWTVQEVTNDSYVLYHLFAVNGISYQIISIMGQNEYSNVSAARAGANDEINSLITIGLPDAEFIPIASCIFQTSNSYSNQSKSRLRTTDLGDPVVDWRTSSISPSSSLSDHGSLGGLSDDDHQQYLNEARAEDWLSGLTQTYNVLDSMFGAVGDGVTDDTGAIQSAIDMAIANGNGNVLIPPNNYFVTGLTINRGSEYADGSCITIDASGAILNAPVNLGRAIVRIGSLTGISSNVVWNGGSTIFTGLSWNKTSETVCDVGFELVNVFNVRVKNHETRNGYYGIRFISSGGSGNAYNIVENSIIRESLNPIHFVALTNDDWVNENQFIGGRIHYSSALQTQPQLTSTTSYAISLSASTTPVHYLNNNRFVDMAIECATTGTNIPACIFDHYGFWNHWIRCRVEGFNYPYFSAGTSTRDDYWDDGRVDAIPKVANSGEYIKLNIRTSKQTQIPGGSSTGATLNLFNRSGTANRVLQISNSAGTSAGAAFSGNGNAFLSAVTVASISATTYSGVTKRASVTLPYVKANEDYTMMFADTPITVTSVGTVVRGSGAISTTWRLMTSEDRSDGGTLIVSGVCNDDSNGIYTTTILSPSVPINSWVWLETTATGGTTVEEFHLTMKYS